MTNTTRRSDPLEARARELCLAAGVDPESRVSVPGKPRGMPAWCGYRDAARAESAAAALRTTASLLPAPPKIPFHVIGDHASAAIDQLRMCTRLGDAQHAVLCADGHPGYSMPVGGVVAYKDHVSISGVGYDIGCGNMAVRLTRMVHELNDTPEQLARTIARTISFGVGRTSSERVTHALFDDDAAWRASGMLDYRSKAQAQLGTVGSGNHYVDLLSDPNGFVWIGVHFGSRGLGHTAATRYLKAAGGRDGLYVPPTLLHERSDLGEQYLAAMHLAGRYAYAGREWVVERVRRIVGGEVDDTVHNHHNFAWKETHHGESWWVVRKGATPAFPGQRGFVGGSMGDDAVILEGVDTPFNAQLLRSTVHGAGRVMGRKDAKRTFSRTQMDAWLTERQVTVLGGDLDESPMAYRRLPDVLAYHGDSVRIQHTLRPFVVVMAGAGDVDPWKD
jgi:tRNA-splicing ligase RtcB